MCFAFVEFVLGCVEPERCTDGGWTCDDEV